MTLPANYSNYLRSMAAVIQPKLAPLLNLPLGSSLIDFGCADCTILKALATVRPDLQLYGLDVPQVLSSLSADSLPTTLTLVTTLEEARSLTEGSAHVTLFLSSVAHEILSHYGLGEFRRLLDTASTFCSSLVLRDMACSTQATTLPDSLPPELLDTPQALSFINRYGPLNTARNVSHFLLKYNYLDNWDYELQENYFSLTTDELQQEVVRYFPLTSAHVHTPPYINDQLYRAYGRHHLTTTHILLTATKK